MRVVDLTVALLAVTGIFAVRSQGPAVAGELEIRNPRLAWTTMGPRRESRSYLPGEKFVLAFEIVDDGKPLATGAKMTATGACRNAAGETIVAHKSEGMLKTSWRGSPARFVAELMLPQDAPPGDYTIEWAMEDAVTHKVASVRENISIRPLEFAIVNPQFKNDRNSSSPAPLVGAIHQTMISRVEVVGETREKAVARIEYQVEIVDSAGEVVCNQGPDIVELNSKSRRLVAVGTLEIAGEFTLRLTAVDIASGKKSSLEFPLIVLAPDEFPSARLAATSKDAAATAKK